jgi:(p)ppGpp synthase/HD superfamily hydrolase
MDNIITIAREYALKSHEDCNQRYANGKPYTFHLQMAADIAISFRYLLPTQDFADVLAGVWCYDIIEDARQTYNDVLKNTNETIAEYAYALTNEKGRNRKERANDKYYAGIKAYKHATFIKLCDRIANVKYSKTAENPRMYEMYKKEHDEFKEKLYDGRFDGMWLALTILFMDK